jgi:hypothetical protein
MSAYSTPPVAGKKYRKAARTGWFHHHMAMARVWVREARTFRGAQLGCDLMAMARADREVAFSWLRAQ